MPQSVNTNKNILDILLERNRLTQTEAAQYPPHLTNEQIEQKLRQDGIVSFDDIAKAYATLFDLPFIKLEGYNIAPDVFQLIPLELIEKYKVVCFDKEGDIPGGRVKLALGYPASFKKHPPQAIEDFRKNKNINLDLYVTTPEDIQEVLYRYQKILAQKPPVQKVIPKLDSTYNRVLKTVDLRTLKIPYEIISKFPKEIASKYQIVVFDNPTPSLIKVAIANPDDKKTQEILDFVRQKSEITVEEFVAPSEDIFTAIDLNYRKPIQFKPPPAAPVNSQVVAAPSPQDVHLSPQAVNFQAELKKPNYGVPALKNQDKEEKPRFNPQPSEGQVAQQQVVVVQGPPVQEDVNAPHEADLDKFLGQDVNNPNVLKQIAQTGNVPLILAGSIVLAVVQRASDIHIEPEEDKLRIRMRVDGILRDIIEMPLNLQAALVSRVKILSHLKIDETRIPQDGRFDAKTHGHEVDLRVSTLPTVRGEKVALRILDKTKSIADFGSLGMSGRNLKILEDNITKPYGIILATGPTGSGKSTTLYSILQKISSPSVNVITLEDPVEYEIPGINQCQIKPKIGFSFADGLRSVLRQDPNIIMVGEIRDAETASMATHAALTGHLVLTTLHTNDAAGALPRLINMGIEPFLITSSINVIIAQRLVRKICPKCQKEFKPPEAILAEIEKEIAKFNLPKPYKFYEGQGCSDCMQGYKGRIGIYEILAMSDKVEELAVKRRPASEIFSAAVAEGMVTMKQDGFIKAAKGLTTISDVLRVTTSG